MLVAAQAASAASAAQVFLLTSAVFPNLLRFVPRFDRQFGRPIHT
jgi:hypothetical protein